jgi:carbamoyltransferase
MIILGISAYYHDSAAAILRDGEIIAAMQEERFSRKKHDSAFPHQAIKNCLEIANIKGSEIDFVAFYDKPFLKFERLLETYIAFAPKGFASFRTAIPVWLKEKLFLKTLLCNELEGYDSGCDWAKKLRFSEHHLSHAASAYFPSPFDSAAILTMDGVGEWATTSVAVGNGHHLEIIKEIHFPHSLGLLYSAFTYYTGFRVNSGEYKVMGLAPYGVPRYAELIKSKLVDIKEDGSFRLDMSFFDYCSGLRMTNDKFHSLFGGSPRQPSEPLTQHHMDLAASVQAVTEEIILRLTRGIQTETGISNLCLAGGVALNCVANGKILRDAKFTGLWIQPAAGDAGGALGAALAVHHIQLDKPRIAQYPDSMRGSFLGIEFQQSEIEKRLTACGAKFEVFDDTNLYDFVSSILADGKAVGWFQGRMEFGPRALGGRSILGDPRSPNMQSVLNLKVKFRESFRPFAPAILQEDVSNWFELSGNSPYMLQVANIVQSKRRQMTETEEKLFGINKLNVTRSEVPAVTHVDYSARVQTVQSEINPRLYRLLAAFKQKTGCPILVNTSFNVRGEPIVCTPEDAFRCFMGCGIELLVIGNCVLEKASQDQVFAQDYSGTFLPD